MCLSIWTPKKLKYSIVPSGKFIILRCPKIPTHYSLQVIIMCLNIGTPNNHHFPFGTNGKVVVLDVPILKHFRVFLFQDSGQQEEASSAGKGTPSKVLKLFFTIQCTYTCL